MVSVEHIMGGKQEPVSTALVAVLPRSDTAWTQAVAVIGSKVLDPRYFSKSAPADLPID